MNLINLRTLITYLKQLPEESFNHTVCRKCVCAHINNIIGNGMQYDTKEAYVWLGLDPLKTHIENGIGFGNLPVVFNKELNMFVQPPYVMYSSELAGRDNAVKCLEETYRYHYMKQHGRLVPKTKIVVEEELAEVA